MGNLGTQNVGDTVSNVCYIVSNDWMLMNNVLGKMWKDMAMGEFKVLFQNFLGGIEKYHKKPQSGWLVSQSRLIQATFQI